MKPFLSDPDLTLYQGDVLEVLKTMPDESVHCVVTSPPYWGLRDYGTGSWDGGDPDCDHTTPRSRGDDIRPGDKQGTSAGSRPNTQTLCACGARRVDNQLGLEATPEEYLAGMVAVFREVRRVLRSDGSCWLNMGDSYASTAPGTRDKPDSGTSEKLTTSDRFFDLAEVRGNRTRPQTPAGLKPKDLCMIPARLALALQSDGWWLRSQIVWSKPNPMPESVTDRPTTSHEFVYLLTRSPRYFFDQEAVREPHTPGSLEHHLRYPNQKYADSGKWGENGKSGNVRGVSAPSGRNLRSVWEIPTQPYPEAHFATYPEELVRRCVLAGSSERGCCPECGAPWTRGSKEIEPETRPLSSRTGPALVPGNVPQKDGSMGMSRFQATDWEPSCGHYETLLDRKARYGVEACTVLDPFFGSGTTGLVARKHGRRTIGIELNPSYCELAARRLQQLSLLA